MKDSIKIKYRKVIAKRMAFLAGRIAASSKDLSYDKAELGALEYAQTLIDEDINGKAKGK